LFRLQTQSARELAQKLTMRRCFWCSFEAPGNWWLEQLADHTASFHPDRPVRYTAYPPGIGIEPKGRDA
jgi:hypothetical protein